MTQNTPKKKNYLNNADMLIEFELSKAQGKMTENFGRMIILLCEKVAKMPKFSRYTYRDDMVGNAIMTITKVWESFDSEKSNNPFSYYTQVCINAFIQILNREKVLRDLRDQMRVEVGLDASWSFQERMSNEDDIDASEHYDSQHESQYHDEFVDDKVYDVTDEYVSVLPDAFGQNEPVAQDETVEEEEDDSDELIAEYMATVTPTVSGGFKVTPIPTPTPSVTPKVPYTGKKRGRPANPNKVEQRRSTPRKLTQLEKIQRFMDREPDYGVSYHMSRDGWMCVLGNGQDRARSVAYTDKNKALAYRKVVLDTKFANPEMSFVDIHHKIKGQPELKSDKVLGRPKKDKGA